MPKPLRGGLDDADVCLPRVAFFLLTHGIGPFAQGDQLCAAYAPDMGYVLVECREPFRVFSLNESVAGVSKKQSRKASSFHYRSSSPPPSLP